MNSIQVFVDRIKANSEVFDKMDDNYVFWGRGNTAELYRSCFEKECLSPKYYIDSNPSYSHTKYINDIEVLPPSEISSTLECPVVFIVSANLDVRREIKGICKQLNLFAVNIDEFIFYKHLDSIIENYEHLSDEMSKETYLELLFSRIDDLEISDDYVVDDQYFCLKQFLHRDKNEVYVDCGAYVGDTIEKYITKKDGVFNKIFAFEPDPSNYKAMLNRTKRIRDEWGYNTNKIVCENMGLDDRVYTISLSSDESSLSAHLADSKDGECVSITTIDEYFKDQKVSFIKADIESYESKLLNGAIKTIQRDHPLLAICIYHNATDFYGIQQQISQIDNNYQYAIRHHFWWECETVLYAF